MTTPGNHCICIDQLPVVSGLALDSPEPIHSIRLIDARPGTVENCPLLLDCNCRNCPFGCWPALNSLGSLLTGLLPATSRSGGNPQWRRNPVVLPVSRKESGFGQRLVLNDPFPGFFPEVYFPVRVLFIISYEGWLRGVILFWGIMGLPAAIALNIVLYAILHPKPTANARPWPVSFRTAALFAVRLAGPCPPWQFTGSAVSFESSTH